MVTIAIVAILAAIALPSFQGSLRSNRMATTTNEMLASLALARSEAIRSSRDSRLCATDDGVTCDEGLDWNAGWMVAMDDDRNGSFESVVRYVQGHPKVVFAGTAATPIDFDYRGRPTPTGTITLQPDECPSGHELVRTLTMNTVGQITTSRSNCT
jgi:type IV fimbrial biogenesis protein FimT